MLSETEREDIKQRRREIRERIAKRLNPDKDVFFEYRICDCEHYGDIEHAEREVTDIISKMGGKVTDNYWDGHDCGEAYVTCKIPYDYNNVIELLETGEFTDPYQE